MDGEPPGIGQQITGQLDDLLLGLRGGIGVREEMHHIQGDPPLGDHPAGHGGVDAAGQQGHRPAVDAHGQAAGPGLRVGVNIGGEVPDLYIHGELRVVHVHLQVGVQFVQFAPHILAELDGVHGETLVRPLGFHLEGAGGGQLVVQELLTGGHDGVLVLLAGAGQGQAHDAEYLLQGLKGALHVAVVALGLHIGGGLAGVDLELAVGPQAAVDVGLQLVLEAAAVQALQHHLPQLQQDDLVHSMLSLRPIPPQGQKDGLILFHTPRRRGGLTGSIILFYPFSIRLARAAAIFCSCCAPTVKIKIKFTFSP